MEETVIQKILSESYNVCNSASAKGFDIKRVLRSYDSKKNRQELQSSYKLQNAPCKPLFLQGFF